MKWDCQNEAENLGEGYDMNELDNTERDEDEVDPELDYGINFEVCVTKGDNKILFDCVSSRDMKIQNIQFFPTGKTVNDETVYGGPRFDDLEEKLQDSFYDYLNDRGVDNEVSFFILSYSAVKEQTEYVNWLNKIVDFTAK